MKNSKNVSNNVNLILHSYKGFFFKLLLKIFDVVGQVQPSIVNWRQRGNEKVLESAVFEICRSIMTKMIDVWNVNKLTASWTKMELGKLQTKVV